MTIGETPTSSTSSSSAPQKTRNKPSLSCTNCRKRKTKCDRKQPCSSCVKKINLAYSCVYDHVPNLKNHHHLQLHSTATPTTTTPDPSEFAYSPIIVPPSSSISTSDVNTPATHHISTPVEPLRKRAKLDGIMESDNPAYEEIRRLRKKIAELEESLLVKNSPNGTSSSHNNSNNHKHNNGNSNHIPHKQVLSPTSPSCPNPVVDDDDVMNFYDGYTPIQIKRNIRRVNYGPLSWIALMKKDPALCLAWKALLSKGSYCIITNKWPQLNSENIALLNTPQMLNEENNSNYMDKVFKKRVLEFEGYDEVVPYKSMVKKDEETRSTTPSANGPVLNFTQITLAKSIFDGRINPELHLIKKIKQIIPRKKVFWTLMDRFFTDVYPYFPFVDEEMFKKELLRIAGPRSYDDVPFDNVKIEKKLDLANIAICFILLRLTYLSFFNNRNCINEYIMNAGEDSVAKFIMLNPINLSAIEVAESCIQCFQFTRKSNLTVFQAMLYMRIYRNHAPEESDGIDGGDSQVGTALLVQMAFSLGINREPDKFDVCNDERINHLGRKMWNFLMRSDLTQCYTLGNPTSIDARHYDAKPPFVHDTNASIEDREMETAVVDTFVYLNSELDSMRKMLDYVLDINNYAKVNDITRDLHEFEVILHDFFNVIGNPDACKVRTDRETVIQYYHVVKLRIFLSMKTALTSLYYHVYLHYEKNFNSELSFFYLSKMYYIIREDLIPAIGHTLLGRYSSRALFLNPNMQLALHKINQINLSCLIRVSYLARMFEINPDHARKMETDKQYAEHFEKLNSLLRNIRKTGDLVRIIMERLGTRYYYSWRIAKAHRGLFEVLSEPENYDKYLGGIKKIKAFQFTPTQLNELDQLIRMLGKCAEKLVYFEDRVDVPMNFDVLGKENTGADGFTFPKTAAATTNHQEATANNNPATPSIVTPFSSVGSPRADPESTSNYVDQMWLLMMAMKYDPNLDTAIPDLNNSCDNESCPVDLNNRDNGEMVNNTNGKNPLLEQQEQLTAQQQFLQQQFSRQMQTAQGNGTGGFYLDSEFDIMGDYFFE
ncbi:Multidrug resistance regulator 1 [Candida viswanathii]|uniref:Multidrug resistance regulator 1 n=1 Tax=Candida viswanathii TaxID=5486 RepID=A0A367XVP9_9ASCO|nr:Multidrug resistance regulator 1 [Candida viswanathii]